MDATTLLANRYRLDATLGEGGMGVVYRAHDTLLDRPVAIKTLYQAMLGDENVRRLMREARAAAGLQHPNIVAIHDVIEDTGTPAIVMELVQGKTLRELAPPLEHLADIVIQVLDALEHAHAKGIVHRDIKPENIMVTDSGVVKVMDFGLARSEGRSRLTQTGLVVGTVAYMAPEQALGGTLDGRTDLYALGCVLYELVTDRRPFESEDPISVISQHVSVPPVTPRWHNKELPPDWEGFILKLMTKDPAERYPSAVEARRAVQALRPAALGETLPAEGEVPPAALLGTVQRGRLVARDAELRELKGYIDLAISGQGQMVTLAGEPGIGKTRLAREGLIYARLRGCRVLAGACYEQEGGVPYLPYTEALQDYVRSRPPSQVAEDIGDQAPELIKIAPDLAHVLPGLTPSPPLDPTHERLRLFDGVAEFLLRLSRASPLVLFLDDLHWADGATLQLTRHLARRVRGERLLVLGTYRDVELDRQHPLADVLREMNRERLYQRTLLRRLDVEGVRAMIAAMFSVEQVSSEFAELIHRETEGNPFFVEEVLKHLIETGGIYREGGQWQRKEIAQIEIPQSVKDVVGRRLEQVSEACRQTLTLASVIGKRFDFEVLLRTADGAEEQVLDALEEAIHSQLLGEEKVGGTVMYDFSHALIRETLYDSLSLRRRMRLHHRVGEALETVHAGNEEAVIEDLAFHYAHASQAEVSKAVGYHLRAGEKAQRLHAHAEALKFYAEAVDLLKDAGREAEAAGVLARMGDPAYFATGSREEALGYLNAALAYEEKAGTRLRAAEIHRRIGRILHLSEAYGPAIPHLRAALQSFEAEGTAQELVRTLLDLARAEQFSGDISGAEREASRARSLAIEHGLRIDEGVASAELGLVVHRRGQTEEARRLYEYAISLCQGNDLAEARLAVRRSYNNLALIAMVQDGPRASLPLFEKVGQLSADERNRPWVARNHFAQALGHLWLGEWDVARGHFEYAANPAHGADPGVATAAAGFVNWMAGDWESFYRSASEELEVARKEGDIQGQLSILLWLTRADLDLERPGDAMRRAEEIVSTVAPFSEYPQLGPGAMAAAAQALAHVGRLDEARGILDWLVRARERLNSRLGRPYNSFTRALIEAKSGRWGEGDRAFREAVEELAAMDLQAEAAWARWIYGRLLLTASGARQEEGRRLLQESLATYERIGAPRYALEIRRRLETP